jgi:hypothetical protein
VVDQTSGHVYPPKRDDPRVKEFLAVHGITPPSSERNINDDFKDALAVALGQTVAWAIDKHIDDLWALLLVDLGIADTSQPEFGEFDLLEGILTEDGGNILKQDGRAIVQE